MGLAGYAAVQRSYALGVLWVVGFHCCLRSGEMFALRAGDIIFGQGSNYAVLNLRLTKTGARRGAQESVTISDSIVAAHLQRVVRDLPPGQLVCSLSGPSQRQIFHEVCRELQLDEHGYGMYSFRRGGATHDFSDCQLKALDLEPCTLPTFEVAMAIPSLLKQQANLGGMMAL